MSGDHIAIPRAENLAMAIRYLRQNQLCQAGDPWVGDDQLAGADHGHSLCWALGAVLNEIDSLQTQLNLTHVRFELEQANHITVLERLRSVDPEWVAMELTIATQNAYWDTDEGVAELQQITDEVRRRLHSPKEPS